MNAPREATSNATILIVDDERSNVVFLERLLGTQGYQRVISTTESSRALELCRAENPDLVLLDIRMPGMSGLQVMQAMREQLDPECIPPVLVVTVEADLPTRLQALELGARDYLTKPLQYVEVLSRIRNALELGVLQRSLRQQKQVLEETVRIRTKELSDTRLEVVRRLGRAAEYRDNETGFHTIRMSKISAALARKHGMSEAECDLILHASPMHDIGKIGIPDAILLKPGKLDAHEWEIMRKHTTIGAAILGGHDSDLLRTARDMALMHHERWDGSGYPSGLAGKEIPLCARIVAVADVFDALTSKRPYKDAWPVSEAVQEMQRLAGTHFDPELVALFHQILPEVVAIIEKYAEPQGAGHACVPHGS